MKLIRLCKLCYYNNKKCYEIINKMGICICCCCNKQKTECLETTLIIFHTLEVIILILGLILINWKIVKSLSLIINIIILIFLLFNLTSVILFKVFREYEKIYSKYKKLCTIFAYISMILSILCFTLAILSESIISEKIYQYDHPCLYKISNYEANSNRRLPVRDETAIKEICDSLTNPSEMLWYNRRSAYKDILMPYICSTIIEVFSFLSIFFYYNDMKRIKYCIKGRMNEDSGLIKYGPFGEYKGKVGERTIIKVNKKIETPKKLKETNSILNINKNNLIEDNSIVLNRNLNTNKYHYDKEMEREENNEFDIEEISNISKKNPSTHEQKPSVDLSNDLEVFY